MAFHSATLRGRASRGDGTRVVTQSFLRSPLPDLGLGHSSGDDSQQEAAEDEAGTRRAHLRTSLTRAQLLEGGTQLEAREGRAEGVPALERLGKAFEAETPSNCAETWVLRLVGAYVAVLVVSGLAVLLRTSLGKG